MSSKMLESLNGGPRREVGATCVVVDRPARSNVRINMFGRVRRVLGPVLLAALAAGTLGLTGCGGKDKKTPTTPGGGGGSGQTGMSDKDPVGDGTDVAGGGGGGGGAGGGDVAGGGGDGGTGGGGGTDGGGDGASADGGPSAPAIVAPNLDPDPVQARGQVEDRLRIARSALSAKPPDAETALREARAALAIDAANIDAAAMTAHALYYKKLYDTAEVMLDELYKRPLAKKNANVAYVYGLVYDKLGKSAEALLAFKNAVSLDAGHHSAAINLGVYQLKNKQYGEAVSTYERVSRAGRDGAEVWNGLGSAYRGKSGDYPAGSAERDQFIRQAETAFKRATQADRAYGPAFYNLGLLYLDADPFPGAGGAMDTLLRLQQARTYFDEYKNMPGASTSLYAERAKDVDKLIKREEKRRKKAARPSN